MAEQVSSEQVQEGVQAPQAQASPDTNDYKAMAANAQSGNDKYEALRVKYGENLGDQLQERVDLYAEFDSDAEGTLNRIAKSTLGAGYGITQTQQQAQASPTGSDVMNPFDFDKQGTTSKEWLNNEIDRRVDDKLKRADGMRQLKSMQDELVAVGITNALEQEKAIERYYRPQSDFKSYATSLKPNQGTQTGAIEQVAQNQQNPQTATVLQSGIEPQPTEHDDVVNQVAAVKSTGSSAAFGNQKQG